MSSIDAAELVNVVPSVQGVGGNAVDVIGLMLSHSTRAPVGQVLNFPNGPAVTAYFGPGSVEDKAANGGAGLGTGYFGGFVGSNKTPNNMLAAQYNTAAVGAWLRGGNVSTLTVGQLQAISGTLNVTIDSIAKTGSVDLSAATSFTNAAQIIADALDIEGATGASFTGIIAGTALTVSALTGTPLAVGQFIHGAGVTAGTYLTAGSGTAWTVSISQTVSSEAMTASLPGVTFDTISGGFLISSSTTGAASLITVATGTAAAPLKLTTATGAVISQGAVAAVPATFMDAVTVQNRNWVTFWTTFDPDAGSGNTVKQAFAAWKNGKPFCYACWDSDITPTNTLPAPTSLGDILTANGDQGTALIWQPQDLNLAAFFAGAAASIDFTQTNGRISFAYKAQPGLVASVTNPTVAANLGGNPQTSDRGNGYNFYGAYANANQNFTWFQRGFITGAFAWADSYINQIWFNSACQSALLNLQGNSKSIPYTVSGQALLESAIADPIAAALNFGMFGPATLTQAQISAVNTAAGANIAGALQASGYYVQILAANPAGRAGRTTPPAKLWYIDLGSVQAINLSSIALQ